MICNVFRPKRKINGRVHVGRLYRGRFKLDGEFKVTTLPLHTTDKQLASQKLLVAVRQREKELAGLTARKPLREAALSPLLAHLNDFLADLRGRKRSESHIKHLETRIKRLFTECRWEHLRDVSADSFQLWRANQKEFSPKTLHEYQNAASSLFAWMERNDRLESNPLRRVGKVERKGHETVKRRSFTNDEMRRLLTVAGHYRLGYLAAVNTGLRRKEPRLEYVLYATLAALLQCENTSLLGVSRMLHDEKYRAWVVPVQTRLARGRVHAPAPTRLTRPPVLNWSKGHSSFIGKISPAVYSFSRER